jgi:hypothetical protein
MSEDARWTSEKGLDGETYEFTATGPPIPLARSIWSPDPLTLPGRLVDLSSAMSRYCRRPNPESLAVLRAKSKNLDRDLVEADAHKDLR